MKLEEAQKHAHTIVELIRDLCDKIEIVGSIRRRKSEVNDADIIAIPKTKKYMRVFEEYESSDGSWKAIEKRLIQHGLHKIRAGDELLAFGLEHVDFPIDIYRARPETWGTLLLIRTGSARHNIILCSTAQHMGLALSAAQGVIKDGKVIASRTEEEIFEALGLDYVPPEKREV